MTKASLVAFLMLLAATTHAQERPDRTLTPGAARPGVTAKQLCDPKFHTGSVRAVSQATKRQVYAEYHRKPAKGVCCEVDHLISLELGGSNDITNLWPEPYQPTATGARTKDKLENHLHRLVCAGKLSLSDAQTCIRTDWWKCYQRWVGIGH